MRQPPKRPIYAGLTPAALYSPGPGGQRTGATIGGHLSSKDFTFNGLPYRVELLPLGLGGSTDPRYEDVPADPTVKFQQTLGDAFGAYYAFRYQGGFRGRDEFSVQSYSVFVQEPTDQAPVTSYGADLYVAYHPDRDDPGTHHSLQWIQVVNWSGTSELDNAGRANPFYILGGLTSIYGEQIVNFDDIPQIGVGLGSGGPGGGSVPLSDRFMAESFLVRDTGTRDAAGKDVVEIFGGFTWGWQVRQLPA
ncbi:MAG: hypothetical protein ACJ73S_19050 [Mycobacteriales bacterium]